MSNIFFATNGADDHEKRNVNCKWLACITLAILFAFVVLIWAVTEYFFTARGEEVQQQVPTPESAELSEQRVRETEKLNRYKVLDAQKGVYQIPIQRAMELDSKEHLQLSWKTIKPN
jgi:hypothetical protein